MQKVALTYSHAAPAEKAAPWRSWSSKRPQNKGFQSPRVKKSILTSEQWGDATWEQLHQHSQRLWEQNTWLYPLRQYDRTSQCWREMWPMQAHEYNNRKISARVTSIFPTWAFNRCIPNNTKNYRKHMIFLRQHAISGLLALQNVN